MILFAIAGVGLRASNITGIGVSKWPPRGSECRCVLQHCLCVQKMLMTVLLLDTSVEIKVTLLLATRILTHRRHKNGRIAITEAAITDAWGGTGRRERRRRGYTRRTQTHGRTGAEIRRTVFSWRVPTGNTLLLLQSTIIAIASTRRTSTTHNSTRVNVRCCHFCSFNSISDWGDSQFRNLRSVGHMHACAVWRRSHYHDKATFSGRSEHSLYIVYTWVGLVMNTTKQ